MFGIGKERLIEEIIRVNYPEDKKTFTMNDLVFILREATELDGKKYLLKEVNMTNRLIYKRFVKFLFQKNLSNLDTMILLTAMKGGGKSSVSIMLAREWCNILGIKFDPGKYMAYTNGDLSRKIDMLPPFSPLIADESVRFISSEDWNKKENKALKKKLAQIREKHLFFILNFPLKIKKVEKVYLESFVNYWMEVYSRGYAAVFVRDSNPVFDSWRLDMFKNVGTYNEFTSVAQIEEKLKRHPNFWKVLKIPKVPKPLYAQYKKVREANVYDDGDTVIKNISKEDIYTSALLLALSDIMTNDSNLSVGRVALHIKNNYDVTISKKDMTALLADAKRMITSFRENMVGSNEDAITYSGDVDGKN